MAKGRKGGCPIGQQELKTCCDDLCRQANENPWGSAYKVAISKLKGPTVPPNRCPEKMKHIIKALFRMHEPAVCPPTPYADQDVHDKEIRITKES